MAGQQYRWPLQRPPQNLRQSATLAACISGILGTVTFVLMTVVSMNSFAGYILGTALLIFYGPISVLLCLVLAHFYLVPLIKRVPQGCESGPIFVVGASALPLIAGVLFLNFRGVLRADISYVLLPYFLYLGVFFCLLAYGQRKALAIITVATILLTTIGAYSFAINNHRTVLVQRYSELENRVSHVRISHTLGEGAYWYRFKISPENFASISSAWKLGQTSIESCSGVFTNEKGGWVGWKPNMLENSRCYQGQDDLYLSYNSLSQMVYMVQIRT